ncbi:MAG: PAS domain S-box protein [Pseudomonadota bacterium]|nr:PAS domain S-box protein [Pseudomonadota bacterium]
MLSISHPPSPGSYQHPPWRIALGYGLGPLLLALSGYGFWSWINVPVKFHSLSQHQLFFIISLALLPLVLFVFVCVTTAQRLVHNRVSASYQMRLDQLQGRLEAQEAFVRSITDNNPESIALFDKDNRYWFVNLSAAKRLGQGADEIIKKPLDKVLGYERARKLERRLTEVRASGQAMETLEQVAGEHGEVRFMQAHYKMLAPFGDFNGGVMLREEDVTGLIVERERRTGMLRQVLGALVAVVDRRDPYAAGHSDRVGQLSRVIAEEMLLTEREIDAAEIAGSLMNFGKVLVPREILTKATTLTPAELKNVRDSILTSADILSVIDFDGPVVPTLRQVMERYDGSGGPQGLKGEQMLVTARIVTVANAYTALASPRAHRPSLGPKEAIAILARDADKLYDGKVVVALTNCLANRRDKLDWAVAPKQS